MPFVRAAELAALKGEAAKVEDARKRVKHAEQILSSHFQSSNVPCPGGCGWKVRLTNGPYVMPWEHVMPAGPVGVFVWTPPPRSPQ